MMGNIFNRNVIVATLGGFQYTYNTVVIAGAVIFLKTAFALTDFQEGIVVSIALFGALFTALFAGVIGNKIGRRAAMGLSTLLFLLGSVVSTTASSFEIVLLGRFIAGLGAGIITLVVPIYLTEIASPETRGMVVNVNQITMALGMIAAYFCNFIFSSSENWRMMFGIGIIPAVIQLIGVFFIIESPHWQESGRVKDASWKHLFDPKYRSRLVIGIGLYAFQQITGISAVMYFAPTIFEQAGYCSASEATFATVFLGIAISIAILISFWCVDRQGRYPLLLWGLWGMVVNLLVLAFVLFFPSLSIALISVIASMIYVAAYSIGIGPVPPLLTAEIFPLEIRGHAMTLTGFTGWIANYLVALTFLPLSEYLTSGGVFCLYAALALCGLWFVKRKVPETKGKSLEEIEKFFTKSKV
jgi:SP family galactose:H+ symporter-like MFS transporter